MTARSRRILPPAPGLTRCLADGLPTPPPEVPSGMPGAFTHCGVGDDHGPHRHTISLHEGPVENALCRGTPGDPGVSPFDVPLGRMVYADAPTSTSTTTDPEPGPYCSNCNTEHSLDSTCASRLETAMLHLREAHNRRIETPTSLYHYETAVGAALEAWEASR